MHALYTLADELAVGLCPHPSLSPDVISVCGTLLTTVAAASLYAGRPGLEFFALVATQCFLDHLDGSVARACGSGTAWGPALDTALDLFAVVLLAAVAAGKRQALPVPLCLAAAAAAAAAVVAAPLLTTEMFTQQDHLAAFTVAPLAGGFGAQVAGVDLAALAAAPAPARQETTDALWRELHTHGFLLFRGQHPSTFTWQAQIAAGGSFGPLYDESSHANRQVCLSLPWGCAA